VACQRRTVDGDLEQDRGQTERGSKQVRERVHQVCDSKRGRYVRNGRMDLLAANRLARAFYAYVYAEPCADL